MADAPQDDAPIQEEEVVVDASGGEFVAGYSEAEPALDELDEEEEDECNDQEFLLTDFLRNDIDGDIE